MKKLRKFDNDAIFSKSVLIFVVKSMTSHYENIIIREIESYLKSLLSPTTSPTQTPTTSPTASPTLRPTQSPTLKETSNQNRIKGKINWTRLW